ncbi:MAG: phosphoribosyltransferase [Arenicellales bacterium WSBS_2016_MAG_OTU3]
MSKRYITAQELLVDSFKLGSQIIESKFRPSFIVGIWRGGTPVGIAVQELLNFHNIKTDHISIRTSSYMDMGQRAKHIRVHGLGYIIDNISENDGLLIVDEVFDSGLSIDAVIVELQEKARKNMPHDIRIATPWFKPGNNKTTRTPDYFLYETEKWLVFPHELGGLTPAEISEHKPELARFVDFSVNR